MDNIYQPILDTAKTQLEAIKKDREAAEQLVTGLKEQEKQLTKTIKTLEKQIKPLEESETVAV